MSVVDAPIVRRALLEILQDAVNRHRDRGDDISTYTAEAVLQSTLSLRGFPLPMERVRGHLFYLKDKNCVKFRETKVGRDKYISWRITAAGTDVLEGVTSDPGIASE